MRLDRIIPMAPALVGFFSRHRRTRFPLHVSTDAAASIRFSNQTEADKEAARPGRNADGTILRARFRLMQTKSSARTGHEFDKYQASRTRKH